MKFLFVIVVLAFLNSACGGLKQSKGKPATVAAVLSQHNSEVRPVKNQLNQVGQYEINGQQSFKIIARIARQEIPDYAEKAIGNVTQVGTLEITRLQNEYAMLSEGEKPDTTRQEVLEKESKIPTFLIQDDPTSNLVSIAVYEKDFGIALQRTRSPVDVMCNRTTACAILRISDEPLPNENFQGMYGHIMNGKVFECHDLGDCTTNSIFTGDSTLIHRNLAELKEMYPKSRCDQTGLFYTTQVRVYNETRVSHNQVSPLPSFGLKMDKLSFEPAPNGN